MIELEPGDRVRDREGDEETALLTVIRCLDVTAEEHVLFAEPGGTKTTVASFHLGKYPADDSVIEAIYGNNIEVAAGSITSGEKYYAFPRSRLEYVEEEADGS